MSVNWRNPMFAPRNMTRFAAYSPHSDAKPVENWSQKAILSRKHLVGDLCLQANAPRAKHFWFAEFGRIVI